MKQVYQIIDHHKRPGEPGHKLTRIVATSSDNALELWWHYSPRNDGGPLDTDRYTAKESN